MDRKAWELKGHQIRELRQALVSVFDESSFKQMLRLRLDVHWNEVKAGETYKDRMFNFIEWVEKEGRVEQLVVSSVRDKSDNTDIQQFVQAYINKLIQFDTSLLSSASLVHLLTILKQAVDFNKVWRIGKSIFPEGIKSARKQEFQDLDQPNLSNWFKCFTLLKLLLEDYPSEDQSSILLFVQDLLQHAGRDKAIQQDLEELKFRSSGTLEATKII